MGGNIIFKYCKQFKNKGQNREPWLMFLFCFYLVFQTCDGRLHILFSLSHPTFSLHFLSTFSLHFLTISLTAFSLYLLPHFLSTFWCDLRYLRFISDYLFFFLLPTLWGLSTPISGSQYAQRIPKLLIL